MLIIASIFIIGVDWASEPVHRFFHSYFADIAIPFGFYLLLILLENKYKPLEKWYIKCLSPANGWTLQFILSEPFACYVLM